MKKTRPCRRLFAVWGIYAVIATFLLVALAWLLPTWHTAILLIGGITVLFAAVYMCLRFRFMAYAVDCTSLTVWSGVLFRSEKHVPLSSIRYVIRLYNLPERMCGVCTLIVYVNGGMLLIEGLKKADAKALQQQLLRVPQDG